MRTTIELPIRFDARGTAWIEGTATKVIEVVLVRRASGLTPDEVQAELPQLTLDQIRAALAYYYAPQEAVDAEIEQRRAWAEQLRAQEPEPLYRADLPSRTDSLS